MKTLSLGYKILLLTNIVLAFLLVLAYFTNYISPILIPLISVLNFSIPVLWILNFIFILIWIYKLKKHFLLSLSVIILGFFHFNKLFVISSSESDANNGLKVMSYNVMQFYSKENIHKSTSKDIKDFILKENPDIFCVQEYIYNSGFTFDDYKYNTSIINKRSIQTVIFSKYPIINTKSYNFYASNNSAKMADIVIKEDTIRVFNAHFESLNLDVKMYKGNLLNSLKKSFTRQIIQFEMLKSDIQNSPYPIILCADMNNTALSYLYRQIIKEGLDDTFLEAGYFYGETFKFKGLPIRLDMIFKSDNLKTNNFKNYKVKYSDHTPVMTKIKL